MPVDPRVYIAIVDMRIIWQMSTPTGEDQEKPDAKVYTWRDFATKIISLIVSIYQIATKIIMVNNIYNLSYSIKDGKRGNLAISRVFPKLKEKFPSVSEFNTFLCTDENKTRLQHLIKNELFRFARSISKKLIYSCDKFVWNVSKNEKILDISVISLKLIQ